jgi:hypothetical protein
MYAITAVGQYSLFVKVLSSGMHTFIQILHPLLNAHLKLHAVCFEVWALWQCEVHHPKKSENK